MSLITGSPYGTVVASEAIYPANAPYIYFQDNTPGPYFAPDSDGYYWQVSGTAAYPVYGFECVEAVSLTEGRTLNDVICDNIGIVDTTESRDYVELQLTVKSLFPLSNLARMLNLSPATVNASQNTEKVGIGTINNAQYWQVWAPKVYDETAADYIAFHLHRVKFVDAWTINMPYANPWNVSGLKLRAYADTTKPASSNLESSFVVMRAYSRI